MSYLCRVVEPAVTWAAVEGVRLADPVARHTEHCLRCQAVSARARNAVRQTQAVASVAEIPPRSIDLWAGAAAVTHPPVHGHWFVVAAATVVGAVIVAMIRRQPAGG